MEYLLVIIIVSKDSLRTGNPRIIYLGHFWVLLYERLRQSLLTILLALGQLDRDIKVNVLKL